ncbi:carbohydrate ABC transporter permease [Sagittula stellata]|uniref:Probable sugar ABC transporter, permease protein n=1 Tax=Sagittula stellata (strain ATCC 700073 / DSM 11524 / E-37) TaxID=388399 RepID=A3K5X8_SAGS3|nr:carbohydrate ABC transporter permease [Sagittula stellata]EBA07517.1 probable sugar ABC transporter, permease protein [Sagittula stellata E-37]
MSVATFLSRTSGNRETADRIGIQDVLAYGYLVVGVLVILVPVLWTLFSSIKPETAVDSFDTRILPMSQVIREIEGVGEKPVWIWTAEDGTETLVFKAGPTRRITEVARLDAPEDVFEVPREQLREQEEMRVAVENYLDPILKRNGQETFNFFTYLANSVFVTVAATLITLLINAMAAFALSKYRFPGRLTFTILIVATLLIPASIILVSLFFVVWSFGIFGSLWGVIIPAAATPTGVFLLRQYMLTIPDELLEAARMDAASEWRIFWRIVLPLSLPALSVLAILSVIWRWNDFLWPLIVLISDPTKHTLQLGLTQFAGEFNSDFHYILAMTVVTLIPITLVFVWLQRFITTGIATTGLK